jgi:hypothetical protein
LSSGAVGSCDDDLVVVQIVDLVVGEDSETSIVGGGDGEAHRSRDQGMQLIVINTSASFDVLVANRRW